MPLCGGVPKSFFPFQPLFKLAKISLKFGCTTALKTLFLMAILEVSPTQNPPHYHPEIPTQIFHQHREAILSLKRIPVFDGVASSGIGYAIYSSKPSLLNFSVDFSGIFGGTELRIFKEAKIFCFQFFFVNLRTESTARSIK